MNRQELMDNLVTSMERGETVTLTLRPIAGCCGDQLVTGKILVLAEHYTLGWQLKVIFRRQHGLPLAIGLTMIKDFEVGARRRPPEREPEHAHGVAVEPVDLSDPIGE